MDELLVKTARVLLEQARARGWKIATAESCTGGLISGYLTEIAGSSDVFDRGFVTYSNAAKTELLGVPAALLQAQGAVSAETARAMVEGALARSAADVAVAVTGIAGPGGGTKEKPVGLVHFAVATRGTTPRTVHQVFPGDRGEVRRATVAFAFELIREELRGLR